MNIYRISVLILTLFSVCNCSFLSTGKETDDAEIEELARGIEEWAMTGSSADLARFVDECSLTTEWEGLDWARIQGEKSSLMCKFCRASTRALLALKKAGASGDSIRETIAKLCTLFKIQTEKVCYGVTRLNAPIFFYIVENDPTINEDDICSLVLQSQGCCELPSRYKWTVDIGNTSSTPIKIGASSETMKVLQVTDIHYDPLYEPSGNAGCDEPTCCRRGQNNTAGSKLAGFWGDYNNCDTPWHSVLDALDEMKTRHGDADLIYFTGDIIDHGIWETTRPTNTKSLLKIFRKIKETFGNNPVYPILGNHEPHPLNQFSPDDIADDSLSTRWLYNLLANIWIDAGWLPESTRETIHRGGYYTVSPRRGFRIIGINNNVAYIFNWWLIYQPVDPTGQLKWLVDTLLEAEKNNEIVHILGHIPNGAPHLQRTWSQEYRKITNRFSHIITAQFNGHTHNDEFSVFYNPDEKNIMNVAWNGGSVTTYADLNPNYRVYFVDANTYEVEEAETWIYNMTEANLTPSKRPNWYKLYSFKEEYGLQNLSKNSLHGLIVDMRKGGGRLTTYHKNFHKHAGPALEKNCDERCLQEHVCAIVTSSSDDIRSCEELKTLYLSDYSSGNDDIKYDNVPN